MKLTFNDEHLKPILAQYASQELGLTIMADDIFDFAYEVNEDETITGVSIEFDLPEKPE